LHSVNGALSSATTYDYDQYQNLTSSLNSLSKTTSYAYDKLNRKTSSTTPLGKATSLQYDANGNITKRTDANGKDTTYQYNNLNRLTQITHPDHSTIQYTYDDRGNMTSMTDPLGTTSYAYDIFNRLTQVTDPNSKVVSYAYSNNDNLAQITYPGSKMATYSYDDAGRLQTITDWNSQQTSYTYYGNGLIKTKTLPNGIVTTYSYDNANRLNSIQHKKSSTILAEFNYTRNAVGDITIATESGTLIGTTISSPSAITVNNLATFSSNSSNTLYTTSSISPTANKLLLLSVASRTGISTNPNQPTVSGNGLTWVAVDSRVYDDTSSSRRRITLFRAMGASPSSGALTISFGGQTQTTYTAIVDQASGIDTSGTNGSGAVVQSANNYDASASVSSLNVTLGSFGNTSNTTYGTFANANGTDSSTAGSGFTKYGDIADSSNDIRLMTEYKNSNDTGVDSSWGGNSELGGIGIELKASGITPPPSTITTTNKTSGSGTSASSINTSSITPGSNKLELLTVSSRTDISTNPNQPTVTGNGLTWVAINSIVYDTTSSSRRRVTMFRAMGASPSSGATTIDFGGQSQTDITWSNDELSGMDTSGTNGSGAIVQSTTNKDESGSATSLSLTLSSFANSANATYAGFGKDGNPSATAGTGFTTTADVASSTNVGTSTEWKNNNDTSVDISYSGAVLIGGIAVEVKAANTSSSNTSIFTYDSLRRLLSATLPSNTFSYTYDLVGNRLTQTADGVETSSTYNNDNKLTQNGSTNYTYDDNGNRITSGSKTLVYNFENKLATQSASGNPTIEFTYDGNGKRLGQKVNGSLTRRYINDVSSDLEKVLITQNLQNSTDNYYLYGNGLISEGGVSSGNRQYYLEDGIGNIRAITDSNGDSIDVIAYDPYGNQLSGSGSAEFKFKGEQLNSDTGYYYMRARYYDPTTGVFTSKDPFDGNLETPQSQNGYNFTNGNDAIQESKNAKFAMSNSSKIHPLLSTKEPKINNLFCAVMLSTVAGKVYQFTVAAEVGLYGCRVEILQVYNPTANHIG
jgi:RHS repeat-associated protein